ncbi:hypothetical protein [Mesorhizobium sp. Root102]|uniref:hypothetical protein n=1 Tax=Mesorhizobium sp. Root102 TaxID=1736422 RepID=UPI001FCCF65F|nr:hypothetical protein [Mesorhizobium sp. Root102]
MTESVGQLRPTIKSTTAVTGAQIHTAGASRFTLASKNRKGVDLSALKAMTKPLMTKKIWTPSRIRPRRLLPVAGEYRPWRAPKRRPDTPTPRSHSGKP